MTLTPCTCKCDRQGYMAVKIPRLVKRVGEFPLPTRIDPPCLHGFIMPWWSIGFLQGSFFMRRQNNLALDHLVHTRIIISLTLGEHELVQGRVFPCEWSVRHCWRNSLNLIISTVLIVTTRPRSKLDQTGPAINPPPLGGDELSVKWTSSFG